jgi:predicted dinucleotide-binding enzyme
MKLGVLGTGMVGEAIASRLAALGHEVMMGSRDAKNPRALAWAKRSGARAQVGTFEDAAKYGELLFNCTHGANSLDALRAAGARTLAGKILIDVANILPPQPRGAESLGEQIQAAFPQAKVVKALNTMNCAVMVEPARLPGAHTVFMSGNDRDAKTGVRQLLESLGWRDIVDLGDIGTARAAENYVSLWVNLYQALRSAEFNINVVRKPT